MNLVFSPDYRVALSRVYVKAPQDFTKLCFISTLFFPTPLLENCKRQDGLLSLEFPNYVCVHSIYA